MRGDKTSQGVAENAWQLSAQEAQALPHGNATLQQEAADLIDDAGPLTDQPLTHAVQCLQVELLGGLRRDELHGRTLHRLGDRLGVAEVVLLSFRIRAHVLRRHKPGMVPKHLEFAAEMMRADASLHADETRRQVGEPCFYQPAYHFCRRVVSEATGKKSNPPGPVETSELIELVCPALCGFRSGGLSG
jgi:hypothetical protein